MRELLIALVVVLSLSGCSGSDADETFAEVGTGIGDGSGRKESTSDAADVVELAVADGLKEQGLENEIEVEEAIDLVEAVCSGLGTGASSDVVFDFAAKTLQENGLPEAVIIDLGYVVGKAIPAACPEHADKL